MCYPGHKTHERIIEEIRARTGLAYTKIEGIDTSQEEIARNVLPILAEWIPVVPEQNIRAAIYSRFNSRHASEFLSTMVRWIQDESSERSKDVLNFAIATALRPSDADYVWQILPGLPKTPAYYALVVKLAHVPALAVAAKDALAKALKNGNLGISELIYIGEVEDARITAWFEQRTSSADKRVRALARKVIDRGKRLPRGVAFTEHAPNRTYELFSSEVDIDQASQTLARLEKQLNLRFLPVVRRAQFLSRVTVDRWIVADCQTTGDQPARVYFRLEDFSTVEIVVLETREGRACPAPTRAGS